MSAGRAVNSASALPFSDEEFEAVKKWHPLWLHTSEPRMEWSEGRRKGECLTCSLIREIQRLRDYHRQPIWAAADPRAVLTDGSRTTKEEK